MILNNIRRLCEGKGISIAALERSLDIGNGTIGKWTSERLPKIETIKKVSDYFGVTIDELIREAPECTTESKLGQ